MNELLEVLERELWCLKRGSVDHRDVVDTVIAKILLSNIETSEATSLLKYLGGIERSEDEEDDYYINLHNGHKTVLMPEYVAHILSLMISDIREECF